MRRWFDCEIQDSLKSPLQGCHVHEGWPLLALYLHAQWGRYLMISHAFALYHVDSVDLPQTITHRRAGEEPRVGCMAYKVFLALVTASAAANGKTAGTSTEGGLCIGQRGEEGAPTYIVTYTWFSIVSFRQLLALATLWH